MCGIIAYIGTQQVVPILIDGLKRLEYRGYDSAGLAFITKDKMHVVKRKGKVCNLELACSPQSMQSLIGIGHTRWATHGEPSDRNSHPHLNSSGTIAVVHNGIIENHTSLKAQLLRKGYMFKSETDTEVLAHLIDCVFSTLKCENILQAVRIALEQVEGTYGIAVLSSNYPDTIIGARKGSPLTLGVGENELFLSSDASAIIKHTHKVVHLEDGDIVEIEKGSFRFYRGENEIPKQIKVLNLRREDIEKGGYKHFMLKEIHDQPRTLNECMRGRILMEQNDIKLDGFEKMKTEFLEAKRIILTACGTSWHSCLVGEYLIEHFCRIPVEVEYSSEFRYRKPVLYQESDILIALSQSGETADTLAAIGEAKKQNVKTFGIVNVVGSTISRETTSGIYLHAGPEIGVASTKAFTGQVLVLSMLALKLAKEKKIIQDDHMRECLTALRAIPDQVYEMIKKLQSPILEASRSLRYAHNFIYLGRGFNFPVALEGALKLKEITYIHAEGYPAAEMKHGPIALIDQFMPVVIIAPKTDSTYAKIASNIEEVRSRKGIVIVITEFGNTDFDQVAEFVFKTSDTLEMFMPILSVIPLQLLSYHIADLRGLDVDRPRNLAKSVTVE